MTTISITKEQLREFFLQWEMDDRLGRCLPQEEKLAKSAEQVAEENADHAWSVLSGEQA